MGRKVLAVAALAAIFPASAIAAPHYFPKPHQHCKSGYVRRIVKVKRRRHGHTVYVKRAECVKKPTPSSPLPSPTPPPLISTTTAVDTSTAMTTLNYTTWFYLAGSVYANGSPVVGLPITYTVTDATTGQQVGTFTGTSNGYALCSVVYSINYPEDTVQSFTGEAVPPYPACNFGSFSMPAADIPLVTASFSGNPTYAASTSSSAPF